MSVSIKTEETKNTSNTAAGFALWSLGFRPFYLLASSYAAFSMLLWVAQLLGWLPYFWPVGSMWHAHEMLLGFVLAVMVGFLLTAGQNWTGRRTLNGPWLMALALLWLIARVSMYTQGNWVPALLNIAFPLLAALALAVPFLQARIRRNYFFIGLLLLMGVAAFGIHANRLGVLSFHASDGVSLALNTVLFVVVVMAGRIIPPFTKNGVPGTQPLRRVWLEKISLSLILAVLIADLLPGMPGAVTGLLLLLAVVAHTWRLALWQSMRTLGTPLVWVLHLAYAWIVLHLILRCLFEFGVINTSVATHALTAGAIGTLTLGMMTRTAKGHTGRPLVADRFDQACYLLVSIGALFRVLLPLVLPAWWMASLILSAVCWSAAFIIYCVRYWPLLTRARLDGKP